MKTTQELKELLYKNKTVADQQPDAIAEANTFCEGYKAFFRHALPYMEFMANELYFERPPINVMHFARGRH